MPKFSATAAAFSAGTVKETQTFVYDAFGREVSTVWNSFGEPLGVSPRSDVWTNQYDDQNRLIRVTSPTGTVFYEYDAFGRKTRVMSRGPAFTPANTTDYENDIRYSYDIFGRLASVQTFERNNVAVDVDTATVGNQPETASYAYTLNGSLDYQTNPDGSITDFTFDDLNRLTDIDEYKKDANTPLVFTDNPKLSEYSYTLRPDGKRDFADEITRKDDGTVFSHTAFDWNYDAAGRLIDEVFTDVGNLLANADDYHAVYTHDLTGNRLKKTVDTGNNGSIDESIVYTFDVNDRMLTESLDTANNGSVEQITTYGYTGTQQSSKSVVSQISNIQISNQTFAYDLQGRMSNVVSTTYTNGTASRVDTIGYRYGTDGIRISARQDVTENGTTTTEITSYLIDAANHTGYQQVLEETVTDGNGNLLKKIVYSIGHDHISQTTFTTGGPAQGTTAVFHFDGHGSTRILTDLAGTILTVAGLAQVFQYDAYGNALNFTMSNAATQYLYSGEQFDARVQQQYLRARYYNQATGTFNRLDPFIGDLYSPQTLNKYLYGNADSINGNDPSGNESTLIGSGTAMAGGSNMQAQKMHAEQVARYSAIGQATGMTWAYTLRVAAVLLTTLGMLVAPVLEPYQQQMARKAWNDRRRKQNIEDASEGEILEEEMVDEELERKRAIELGFLDHFEESDDSIPVFVERTSRLHDVARADLRAQLFHGKPLLLTYHAQGWYTDLLRDEAQRDWRRANGRLLPANMSLEEYPFASTVEGGFQAHIELVDKWMNDLQGGDYGGFLARHNLLGRPGSKFIVLVRDDLLFPG